MADEMGNGNKRMSILNYWTEIGLHPHWVQRLSTTNIPSNQQDGYQHAAETISLETISLKSKHSLPTSPSSETSTPLDKSLAQYEKPSKHQDSIPIIQSSSAIALSLPDWSTLEEQIHACRACSLGSTRTHAVPGVGPAAPLKASWMIIGEAPGAEEDRLGEPFVGQAGKLLDAMLSSIGLSRHENVYIANVLKCRPPENRRPHVDEVHACVGFLHHQLALVQPTILIALGATAAQALLNTDAPIGKLRGTVHHYQGLPLIATYHPAYLLRSPAEKSKAWEDLCLAKRTENLKLQA